MLSRQFASCSLFPVVRMKPSEMCIRDRVHRGEGNGPLLLAASPMVLTPSTVFAWQDSSRTLRSGGMYRYAVRAISTSHVTGAFGDTVTVMPVHNSKAPLPPRELTAQVDGGIAIIRWEDQSSDPLWQEYLVIRTSHRGEADTLHLSLIHI